MQVLLVNQVAFSYGLQHIDTGYSLEDLPGSMNDR